MFHITPPAAQEILAAARRSDADGLALRVAAQQLADGSVSYGMGFDDERVDDISVEFTGLTVLLGPRSRDLLQQVELDYVELEPGRFDFVFLPTAAATEAATDAAASAATTPAPACGSGGCSRCAD